MTSDCTMYISFECIYFIYKHMEKTLFGSRLQEEKIVSVLLRYRGFQIFTIFTFENHYSFTGGWYTVIFSQLLTQNTIQICCIDEITVYIFSLVVGGREEKFLVIEKSISRRVWIFSGEFFNLSGRRVESYSIYQKVQGSRANTQTFIHKPLKP